LNPRTLVWVAVLALLWLGGCRTLPPAPPTAAVSSPEELLAILRARQQRVPSFQAKGRLTFLSPERNYSGTALLSGVLPSTLKVTILDVFGRTILSFASNGSQVQVLSPREGKLFTGRATPRNLAAFVPPTVTLPQALRLLVGALPFSQGPPDRFTYEADRGQYLLEWRPAGGGVRERLWVAASGLYPVKEEWFGEAGEPRFTAELAGFGLPAPDLPEKITLKTLHPQSELRLVYQELHLNPSLSPADWRLQPPVGVAVVPLGP
jgi:hypothetical protein